MSNYHFYFGGGFQVATGSSQTTDQRSRNYGHRDIADSPQLRHVSPHSSTRNRSAVELLSRQEAKSRRSRHPRSRSRSKRIRKASSKSRSLSSEDRVQPAMHAPSRIFLQQGRQSEIGKRWNKFLWLMLNRLLSMSHIGRNFKVGQASLLSWLPHKMNGG